MRHITQDTTTALCAPTRLVLVAGELTTMPHDCECVRCLLMLLAHAAQVVSVVGQRLAQLEAAGEKARPS